MFLKPGVGLIVLFLQIQFYYIKHGPLKIIVKKKLNFDNNLQQIKIGDSFNLFFILEINVSFIAFQYLSEDIFHFDIGVTPF